MGKDAPILAPDLHAVWGRSNSSRPQSRSAPSLLFPQGCRVTQLQMRVGGTFRTSTDTRLKVAWCVRAAYLGEFVYSVSRGIPEHHTRNSTKGGRNIS